MQRGNAIENWVAQHIKSSPELHGQLFRRAGGPGRPDFFGQGFAHGINLEVTTTNPITIQRHLARPYGQGLQMCTYQRSGTFVTFPQ